MLPDGQPERMAVVGTGPLSPSMVRNLDEVFSDVINLNLGSLSAVADSGDLRLAWPLVDLLRFHEGAPNGQRVLDQLRVLTDRLYTGSEANWVRYTDFLLARDVPAPPGYLEWKRRMYLKVDPRWAPFFDTQGDLDWRLVTWGGVLRNRIRALVDPPIVPAGRGSWLPDADVVIGVVVNGEARAYPRRVMDVHELVNDTLGGRRIALPYCTLCGAAIAYFTDGVPGGPLEMRTSGLLQRSNKLMYDVQTESLFDQFDGVAVTGPLNGTRLRRHPVTISTWGDWKAAHPDTTVIAEGAGTGHAYRRNFLGNRDKFAPIFPVGARDRRLPGAVVVFGVVSPRGASVAFPVAAAREELEDGGRISHAGVEVHLEAGGLVARPDGGGPILPGLEAYWFAWSQFRPGTLIWQPRRGEA